VAQSIFTECLSQVKTDMGGDSAPLTVEDSASGILSVLENLTEDDNGKFLQFDGKEVPW